MGSETSTTTRAIFSFLEIGERNERKKKNITSNKPIIFR
jgi:hypothetical protein